MEEDQYLTPRQAADFLGVSPTTLWQFERDFPDFPKPTRITPRLVRYSRIALADWMESRRAAT